MRIKSGLQLEENYSIFIWCQKLWITGKTVKNDHAVDAENHLIISYYFTAYVVNDFCIFDFCRILASRCWHSGHININCLHMLQHKPAPIGICMIYYNFYRFRYFCK